MSRLLTTGESKYETVRNQLLEMVELLPDGAAIPAERALSEQFGVARMTLRKAVDELVESGELRRLPGRGTFIVKGRFITPDGTSSFHAEVARHGMRPGSHVVDFARRAAGPQLAVQLDLSPRDEIMFASRVRLADDEPVAIERISVPGALVPGLVADDLEDASFYEILTTRYGIELVGARRVMHATVVNEEEAELLGIPPHVPAFFVVGTRVSATGVLVEHLRGIYRGDRYRIVSGVGNESAQPTLNGRRRPGPVG